MLGQITYPSKSTGDVVDNLMGSTETAKALPLSAYQGYVLDGKIAAINNNFSNIQVASLTVTTQEASAAGQPITIANSAYTITANFDSALSVTVPIYTWGNYTVASGDISREIAISPDKFDYIVELTSNTYLYKYGEEYNSLTGGWISWFYNGNSPKITKKDDYIQVYIPHSSVAGGVVTKNQIALSGNQNLCFLVDQKVEQESGGNKYGVSSKNTSSYLYNTAFVTRQGSFDNEIIRCPLNNIDIGYPNTGCNGDRNYIDIKIYKIWLEK